jgi:hypothetical protein
MMLADLGADVLRIDRTEPSGLGVPMDTRFDITGRSPQARARLGLSRTFQRMELFTELTVREHLWQERDFGKRLGVIRSRGPKEQSPSGHDQPGWGPPVTTLYATGKGSVIHIGLSVEVLIQWLRRFDPHYLLTYPSLAREILYLPERKPAFIPQPAMDENTEVSDGILDQAEVYMAHGHGELAIHLLQEHLREAPRESPVPWLLLLDLLLRAGDHAGFAAASAECSRYFNINLVSQNTDSGNGLEAYPHLTREDVLAAMSYAADTIAHEETVPLGGV